MYVRNTYGQGMISDSRITPISIGFKRVVDPPVAWSGSHTQIIHINL